MNYNDKIFTYTVNSLKGYFIGRPFYLPLMFYLFFLLSPVGSLYPLEVEKLDSDEISDLLLYFTTEPLDLNIASADDLYEIPYIELTIAERIVSKRREIGEFKRVEELLDFNLIDRDVYEMIESCFVIESIKKPEFKLKLESRFKQSLQKSRAYLDDIYQGERYYAKSKMNFATGNYFLSVLSKKDPGEINYSDSYKYSVGYKSEGLSWVFGNFNYKSPSFFNVYESSFIDLQKVRTKFKPIISWRANPSSMDIYGFDGILSSAGIKNHILTVFYGEKRLSASLNDDGKITSISSSGYNRTENEITKYENLDYNFLGSEYQFSNNLNHIILTYSRQKYSKKFADINDQINYSGVLYDLLYKRKIFKKDIWKVCGAYNENKLSWYSNYLFKIKKGSVILHVRDLRVKKYAYLSSSLLEGKGEKEVGGGAKVRKREGEYHLELQTDFYRYGFNNNSERFFGSYQKIELFKKSKLFEIKFSLKYQRDNEIVGSKYIDCIKKTYQIRYKRYTDKVTSATIFKYVDNKEDESGYGYQITQILNFLITKGLIVRIGLDSFFTSGEAVIYSNQFDTGIYSSLKSYKGRGNLVYLFSSYKWNNFRFTVGFSELLKEYSTSTGSGYDEIDGKIVDKIELNLHYSL